MQEGMDSTLKELADLRIVSSYYCRPLTLSELRRYHDCVRCAS